MLLTPSGGSIGHCALRPATTTMLEPTRTVIEACHSSTADPYALRACHSGSIPNLSVEGTADLEDTVHFSTVLSAEENPVHEDNRRERRSEGPKKSIEANQHGRSEMEHRPGKKQRYQHAGGRYKGYRKNYLDDYH